MFFSTFYFIPSLKNAKAAGTTYYVSKTGSSDSYNCTSPTFVSGVIGPCLTLNHAESAAATGDTVHVAAGTYVENDAGTHGWNSQKGIAWIADGTVVVRGTSPTIRILYIDTNATASYTGFTIDAQGLYSSSVYLQTTAANKTFTNVTFSGATSFLVNSAGTVSNIIFSNCTFTASVGYAFYGGFTGLSITQSNFNLSGSSGALQSGNTISGTIDHNTFTTTTNSYIILINGGTIALTVTNNTLSGDLRSFLYVAGGGTMTIQNNTITATSATSSNIINLGGGTWTTNISNNTITAQSVSQSSGVISLNVQGLTTISGNTIESFGTAGTAISVSSTGGSSASVTVQNNTLKSRSTSSYVIAVGSETVDAGTNKLDGALIEGNTVYGALYYDSTLVGVGTHSIYCGFNKNCVIRYNTVLGGGYGVVVKGNGMAYTSGGIYYNKFINSTGTVAIRVKGIQNIDIYNNDIYTVSPYPSGTLVYITDNNAGETSTGTVLKNNILYGQSGHLIYVDPDSQTGFTSDYNIIYSWGGNAIGTIGSTSYNDFNSWKTGGYDTHGASGDPLFINTSSNDFHLQPTSPAIDSGIDLNIATDNAGKQHYDDPTVTNTGSVGAFSKNYVDIGAYEYVTPPNPVLQSVSCPSQSSSCNNTTPDISVLATSSTTSYNYLIDQTLSPLKASVVAGTADADGSFSVPTLTIPGTYYIHVIAKNLDGDFAANYGTYAINYASTPIPSGSTNSSAPTTLSTPVAKFPETGIPPSHNNIPRNIVMLSGVIASISVSLVVLLRKRRIT